MLFRRRDKTTLNPTQQALWLKSCLEAFEAGYQAGLADSVQALTAAVPEVPEAVAQGADVEGLA